ncbi:MAG: HAD-IA family hydrolase [Candidatus Bathyarchaeia archaeon]
MQVKAILFDLFDTLLLVEGGDAFYEPALKKLYTFLSSQGLSVDYAMFRKAYFEVRDSLYRETLQNLEEPHFNIRVHKTLESLGFNHDPSSSVITQGTATFAEEFMRYVHLDSDAIPLLRELKKKYKLGIVSNFAIPECLHRLLENFGIKQYFDVVIVSAEVNRRKPSPEIFQKALATLNVKPSEAIFVGDTLVTDIEGAQNAGIKAILIQRKSTLLDTPQNAQTQKQQTKPHKTIQKLAQLLALLNAL